MPVLSRKQCHLFLLVWALMSLAGCVSPKSSAPVQVTVTTTGMVRYLGAQFPADQLPARLAQAEVDKEQEIRIRMQDAHQTLLIKQISELLKHKGYSKVLFLATPRATSEVTGAPETRKELPVPSSPSVAP